MLMKNLESNFLMPFKKIETPSWKQPIPYLCLGEQKRRTRNLPKRKQKKSKKIRRKVVREVKVNLKTASKLDNGPSLLPLALSNLMELLLLKSSLLEVDKNSLNRK